MQNANLTNLKLQTAIGTIEIKEKKSKVISLKLPEKPPRLPLTIQTGVMAYKDLLSLAPDLSIGTPFQQMVWQYIRNVPCGHTVTYKKIAEDIDPGSVYRAVGQACKTNPMPIIIPCHRVVASDGTLGGYSCGYKWKRFLLELEKSMI